MSTGALLFFIVGVVLLGRAVHSMSKIRTFSFKNKKVLLREKMVLTVAGIGFICVLYSLFGLIF